MSNTGFALTDRVLVTGARGFVGSALCRQLLASGFRVKGTISGNAALPQCEASLPKNIEWVTLNDRSTEDETKHALEDVQIVAHLAARVHVMRDHVADPLRAFRQVNVVWSERLAGVAAAQGVRRFVYMSSVKVNGEASLTPMNERDAPSPQDPYGVSKWEAEQVLQQISAKTGLGLVVLRSPLVYGPGVRGNFLQLLKMIQRHFPLPLASIDNRRSLVYRGNLVDALMQCIRNSRAMGQTYFVSDGEDLSTPELVRRIGQAMHISVPLWPVPAAVLWRVGRIAGQEGVVARLVASLQVDSSKIRRELNWEPPFTVDLGLQETAHWFLARGRRIEGAA